MCFIALSWHIFSGVLFLWTDRLVILARPVFPTSYICLVSLLAPVGIEWTSYLPWTDRIGSVFWAAVRTQTRFVRYFHHLMEGGQFPCNPQKNKKTTKEVPQEKVICTWSPRCDSCRRSDWRWCSCIPSVKRSQTYTHRQQRRALPTFAQNVACKYWSEPPSSIGYFRQGPPAPQLHLLAAKVSAAQGHAIAHPTGIKMASSGWQKRSSYSH